MTAFDVDPQIRPQDDLFRHVNGPWLANTPIPDDKPSYGAASILRDAAEEAVRDIVRTMPTQRSSTAQDLARGRKTEIDHLNGVMFYDRIDPEHPFAVKEGMLVIE